MKTRFVVSIAVIAFGSALLCGCNQGEPTPKIDPAAAKAQPGADTPPAATGGAMTESQMRQEKAGGK